MPGGHYLHSGRRGAIKNPAGAGFLMRRECRPTQVWCRIDPPRTIHQLQSDYPAVLQLKRLFEVAQGSVQAGTLAVLNRQEKPACWSVRPADFARWLAAKQAQGADWDASVFAELLSKPAIARKTPPHPQIPKALQAANAAFEALWGPALETASERVTSKQVVDWLSQKYPGLSRNTYEQIDAIIRPDDAKKGGNLPSKGLTLSKQKNQRVKR